MEIYWLCVVFRSLTESPPPLQSWYTARGAHMFSCLQHDAKGPPVSTIYSVSQTSVYKSPVMLFCGASVSLATGCPTGSELKVLSHQDWVSPPGSAVSGLPAHVDIDGDGSICSVFNQYEWRIFSFHMLLRCSQHTKTLDPTLLITDKFTLLFCRLSAFFLNLVCCFSCKRIWPLQRNLL